MPRLAAAVSTATARVSSAASWSISSGHHHPRRQLGMVLAAFTLPTSRRFLSRAPRSLATVIALSNSEIAPSTWRTRRAALSVSPRIGHLHISVNDLPWLWADASDNNTVDIAGFPPGEHKVKIDLVDSNHEVLNGQSVVTTFTVPATGKKHAHK
jgi:hypothetical protein